MEVICSSVQVLALTPRTPSHLHVQILSIFCLLSSEVSVEIDTMCEHAWKGYVLHREEYLSCKMSRPEPRPATFLLRKGSRSLETSLRSPTTGENQLTHEDRADAREPHQQRVHGQ